jgi:hypothetical protein
MATQIGLSSLQPIRISIPIACGYDASSGGLTWRNE